MKTTELRERLHEYIDNLDEERLDEVYSIIKDEDIPWKYSAKDVAMLYQRRNSYQNGEGKNYTIEESISSIRKK